MTACCHRAGWSRRFDWNRYRLRRGPYRSRQGRILGVCAGLAEYFDLSVTGVRIVTVLILIFTGFWPGLGLYLLAAVLMKPVPLVRTEWSHEETREPRAEAETSFREERRRAMDGLKRTFDDLNRRLRKVEDEVTSKEFDWERRYRQS